MGGLFLSYPEEEAVAKGEALDCVPFGAVDLGGALVLDCSDLESLLTSSSMTNRDFNFLNIYKDLLHQIYLLWALLSVPIQACYYLAVMYDYRYKKRVRYSETDKMGYLYYGHYAKYYEIGRVEALRDLGLSYQKMEDQYGIMLPVLSLESRFRAPAYYDEELEIVTKLKEQPSKMITFNHEIINPDLKIINTAIVKLFFVDMKTGKRVNTPAYLLEKLKPYFPNNQN